MVAATVATNLPHSKRTENSEERTEKKELRTEKKEPSSQN
jgi:hypothetical protein